MHVIIDIHLLQGRAGQGRAGQGRGEVDTFLSILSLILFYLFILFFIWHLEPIPTGGSKKTGLSHE